MSKWDELSMTERAAMMKVAVRNGITNLSDIREKYNEFAGGGNTKSDDDLIDRIIQEEGFSKKPEDIGDGKMTLGSGLTAKKWHDLYEKRGNKWSAADNRRAVAEEVANRRRWAERNIPNWEKLPDSSQKALLSYKYNYDFTRSNSPKLFKALEAGNLQEAARQIDATSKDPKFKKGLQARRQREQNWFLSDLNLNQRPTTAMPVETPVSTAMYNPFAIQQQTTQAYPIMVPDEDSYVTAHPLTTGELKAQEMKERFDAVNRFNALMNMIGFENNPLPSFTSKSNVFLDSLSPLINGNANGGKIYIKPSHRGRLTELKARTGKTEAELYNDGNPAHKRMVVFARNSRKWKHEDGGIMNSIMDVVDKPDVAFSTAMMKYIRNAGLTGNINPFTHKWSTTKDSPAQDTFLNLRDTQKREFLRRGWIEGKEGDYGLVRKAAESKGYPIYQRNPDAIGRKDLIVLGNTYEPLLDAQHLLPHSGSTPSAVYTDGQGNFYQKQWDLNDYGGNGGSTTGMLGKILDTIGSPTVVTSGFQPIDKNERLLSNPYGSPKYIEVLKPMMAQKGLVPTKIDGETKWTIPEVVITGKRRKHGLGGFLI